MPRKKRVKARHGGFHAEKDIRSLDLSLRPTGAVEVTARRGPFSLNVDAPFKGNRGVSGSVSYSPKGKNREFTIGANKDEFGIMYKSRF